MTKPSTRPYSRYSLEAAVLLGQLIRLARIGHRLTFEELAERAGISRGLLHRIEKGDPGCAIGSVFEVAAIVGVRLFDADQPALAKRRHQQRSNADAAAQIGAQIDQARQR